MVFLLGNDCLDLQPHRTVAGLSNFRSNLACSCLSAITLVNDVPLEYVVVLILTKIFALFDYFRKQKQKQK